MISASPHVQSDPRSSNGPVHVSRTRLYDLLIRDDPELDTILMDRRHDVNLLQKLLPAPSDLSNPHLMALDSQEFRILEAERLGHILLARLHIAAGDEVEQGRLLRPL